MGGKVYVASHLTREGQHGAGHHLFSQQLGQETFPSLLPILLYPITASLLVPAYTRTPFLAQEKPTYKPLTAPKAFPATP